MYDKMEHMAATFEELNRDYGYKNPTRLTELQTIIDDHSKANAKNDCTDTSSMNDAPGGTNNSTNLGGNNNDNGSGNNNNNTKVNNTNNATNDNNNSNSNNNNNSSGNNNQFQLTSTSSSSTSLSSILTDSSANGTLKDEYKDYMDSQRPDEIELDVPDTQKYGQLSDFFLHDHVPQLFFIKDGNDNHRAFLTKDGELGFLIIPSSTYPNRKRLPPEPPPTLDGSKTTIQGVEIHADIKQIDGSKTTTKGSMNTPGIYDLQDEHCVQHASWVVYSDNNNGK